MLPNCSKKEIGIREGEKIHELMITRDDARFTLEFDKHYIIMPHFNWWNNVSEVLKKGKPVPKDFEYTSNGNKQWLNVEELRKELERNKFI